MVEYFLSAAVHAQPETNEQVELEGLLPFAYALKLSDALYRGIFFVEVDMAEAVLLERLGLNHVIDDCCFFHVDEKSYVKEVVKRLWDCLHPRMLLLNIHFFPTKSHLTWRLLKFKF